MYRIYFIFRVVIVLKLIGSIVRFFKSFLPVFSKHFVICVTAIALVVTAASGVNSVKDCYLPLLFAAAFSAATAAVSTAAFGCAGTGVRAAYAFDTALFGFADVQGRGAHNHRDYSDDNKVCHTGLLS